MKRGKKYRSAVAKLDPAKTHTLKSAISFLRDNPIAKFNETFEVHIRLGVDPRKADQNIRGTVSLPHGLGRSVRIAVFAEGEKAKEAQEAGADIVGDKELIEKIAAENWLDFDVAIATPDMMKHISKIGKILGPRGLMPNPKSGTVTFEVGSAVKEFKAGKVEYRVDKTGNVHCPVGKRSFAAEALEENIQHLIDAVVRARPASAKGIYVRNIVVTTTMGPGLRIDLTTLGNLGAAV